MTESAFEPIRSVHIGARKLGPDAPCFVVAEVAQAHDGSLGTAHAYIDAAARAGADAVKFQTHIAAAESTAAEPWRVKFSPQDATRYDYWKRMEFTEEQWRGLVRHAAEKDLVFLSSPFSNQAVDLLQRLNVPAWKVGSGEIGNVPMLERMARTGKPVILSSGMTTFAELDRAVELVRGSEAGLVVLQCTSSYPNPPETTGLNVMAELRDRYRAPTGLSDHSGTIYAGLAAAALGANMIEVHIAFSRECFGPDVSSSLTTTELADLVRGVRFIERALAHPIDKHNLSDKMLTMRSTFGKSVVAGRKLPAGHRIAEEDLAFKKPGNGIPAGRYKEVLGRQLLRDLEQDSPILEEYLD